MESTIELLYNIRNHIESYLGKESLLLLHTFLKGYEARKYSVEGKPYCENEFIMFQLYIRGKFNAPQEQPWYETIASHSSSDEDAFHTFYRLLDEFLKEEEEQMESLFKLLYKIREKPVFYLKRKDLELLRTYIDGYQTRQYELDENYRGSLVTI